MRPMLPRSLQGRLTLLVLALVSVVWVATALITWRDVRHELDELLDGHLAQAAALLVVQRASSPHDEDDDHDEHGIDAPQLHRYATKVAFQVWHDGRLTQRSSNAPTQAMLPPGKEFKTGFHNLRHDGADWRVFATHGAERDIQVYVGEQVRARREILFASLRGTLWPLALALPLLALAVWWAVRRGTAPLRGLGGVLAARSPSALDRVSMDGAPAEMAPMVEALNGLFERIGRLLESERRFTADAAHELRTPIAAIRTQAQVALGEADDALRRHALQATLQGCDRATHLVEQLLTLSRLEAAQAPPSPAGGARAAAPPSVDLGALARRTIADLAAQAIAKEQSIELDATSPCPIAADEVLIGVLLRNLLDNAIRYSPRGAAVHASVRCAEGRVRLRIEDSGPGLAESELARLGERFFRVLGSGEGGSGLGWSIVRRIAAVQGAELQVGRSDALGGLCVELHWPRAGAAARDAGPAGSPASP